jgi:hypothetical protein
VASNTLSGTGLFGIYAASILPTRAGGRDKIDDGDEVYNNTITGFATPLYAPGARRSRGR